MKRVRQRISIEQKRRATAALLGTSSIVEAVRNPEFFAPHFDTQGSWRSWYIYLKALFGLGLEPSELPFFQQCTGLAEPPKERCSESWLIVGRRGGKSFTLALIAVFLACFVKWDVKLAPGERATIMVIATDKKQAGIIFNYAKALIQQTPVLAALMERDTTDTLQLSNRLNIEVRPANFRSVRGYTIPAVLADEMAFWPTDESANPDREIIAALRPAMASVPGAMLLCGSSPYAKRGMLWESYRDHFGKAGPQLIWQADTRTMNPTIPQEFIDQEYDRDPIAAAAEYGAQFRSDVEAFITPEVVDSCVATGVHELPPQRGMSYVAFTDPSGGSVDSFTLAIAHAEGEKGVLDLLRETRPPFSPDAVVKTYSDELKRYGIFEVRGDKYGGEWPRERFMAHGISYVPCDEPKSEIYVEALPLLNTQRAQLLDIRRLKDQLVGLERKAARSGKESIDHAPGGHDDVANVAAGALVDAVGDIGGLAMWRKLAQ